jgi:zinc transport system permease protein
MGLLSEPFYLAYMRHALLAGLMVGGLCALIGTFVVQRGLAFLGDGLSHAAFGGIALGLLLGVAVARATWVAVPFTVAVALGIGYVLRRGKMRGDVATGVFFAVSFALGVLFLNLRPDDAPPVDLESMLFGSVLAINTTDLWIILGVTIVVTAILLGLWSRLAYATFDPELAAVSGVQVAVLDYTLLALTAIVVVVAVKMVGVVLVSSFVVIPAATARMLGRTLARVAGLAVVIGTACSAAGLLVSYYVNAASGATIILALGGVFGVTLALRPRAA